MTWKYNGQQRQWILIKYEIWNLTAVDDSQLILDYLLDPKTEGRHLECSNRTCWYAERFIWENDLLSVWPFSSKSKYWKSIHSHRGRLQSSFIYCNLCLATYRQGLQRNLPETDILCCLCQVWNGYTTQAQWYKNVSMVLF